MKLIFISVILIYAKYVFSAKDVGTYFVLDNIPKNAYLFTDNDCEKTYICTEKTFDPFHFGMI